MTDEVCLHATTVLLGAEGLLIRGGPGSGKTSFALTLVAAAGAAGRFARFVADDRTLVAVRGARLVARAPAVIAGLVERRGGGVSPVLFEPACVVRLVLDLAQSPPRLPEEAERSVDILGVRLPRRALRAGEMSAAAAFVAELVAGTLAEAGGDQTLVTAR